MYSSYCTVVQYYYTKQIYSCWLGGCSRSSQPTNQPARPPLNRRRRAAVRPCGRCPLGPTRTMSTVLSAAPASDTRKAYMEMLGRARSAYSLQRASADHDYAVGVTHQERERGAVLRFMDAVIADILGNHGCLHAIGALERVQGQICDILRELKAISSARGDQQQLHRLTSLRQAFIVLNTTTVVGLVTRLNKRIDGAPSLAAWTLPAGHPSNCHS